MSRKLKRPTKAPITNKGKRSVDPIVLKCRNIRSALLRRVHPSLKHTTPTIIELQKWLSLPYYTCYYSLESLTLETVTIDHKIPIARGGSNSLGNLCFASAHMNSVKGQMNEEEFRGILQLVSGWEDQGRTLFTRLKMGHFKR